jgi:uncharacterized membrane protein YtjA (UPF0391 family)
MLTYTLIFLLVAIVAGLLGFTGIAGVAGGIEKYSSSSSWCCS